MTSGPQTPASSPAPPVRLTPRDLLGAPRALGAGHAACAGCSGIALVQAVVYAARDALGRQPVITCSTGCLSALTCVYPANAWRVPYLHAPGSGAISAAAGIEAAARVRRIRGETAGPRPKVIAIVGYPDFCSCELGALAAAAERGQEITVICWNNEGGLVSDRPGSSGAPCTLLASMPRGTGLQPVRELTRFAMHHGACYAAQTSVHCYQDMLDRMTKAVGSEGLSFVNVLVGCPPAWGIATDSVLDVAALAVDSQAWPLYEYERGSVRITYRPQQPRRLAELLECQPRFRHLSPAGEEPSVCRVQKELHHQWSELLEMERSTESRQGGAESSAGNP